jgi:hypothetical protein
MPDQNRKSKTLSVRLSPEEYESLKAMHEARGISSVSKLAREAMQSFLNGTRPDTDPAPPPQVDCEAKIRFLDSRLNNLQGEVSQLARLLSNGIKKES